MEIQTIGTFDGLGAYTTRFASRQTNLQKMILNAEQSTRLPLVRAPHGGRKRRDDGRLAADNYLRELRGFLVDERVVYRNSLFRSWLLAEPGEVRFRDVVAQDMNSLNLKEWEEEDFYTRHGSRPEEGKGGWLFYHTGIAIPKPAEVIAGSGGFNAQRPITQPVPVKSPFLPPLDLGSPLVAAAIFNAQALLQVHVSFQQSTITLVPLRRV